MSKIADLQDALQAALDALPAVTDGHATVIIERGPDIEHLVSEALGRLSLLMLIGSPTGKQTERAKLPSPMLAIHIPVFIVEQPALNASGIDALTLLESAIGAIHEHPYARPGGQVWQVTGFAPSDDPDVFAWVIHVTASLFF